MYNALLKRTCSQTAQRMALWSCCPSFSSTYSSSPGGYKGNLSHGISHCFCSWWW